MKNILRLPIYAMQRKKDEQTLEKIVVGKSDEQIESLRLKRLNCATQMAKSHHHFAQVS